MEVSGLLHAPGRFTSGSYLVGSWLVSEQFWKRLEIYKYFSLPEFDFISVQSVAQSP